jgi:hypothetical protein
VLVCEPRPRMSGAATTNRHVPRSDPESI